MEVKSSIKVCGGQLLRIVHSSTETATSMTFAVYLPSSVAFDKSSSAEKVPCLLYLSGLTCTDENVCQKSGVFSALDQHQMALIAPDTSPRGAGVAGEDDSWDFGTGAGFYLDATAPAWSKNYRMYSYVTKELLSLVQSQYTCLDLSRMGITGHSMGGHGALTIAFKNPTMFKSVSAFAPICNPSACPWGLKAFTNYLSEDKSEWSQYDATELLKASVGKMTPFDDVLIDVGTADSFLTGGQLLPEALEAAALAVGQKLTLRYQDGYDHSYFFIASFIAEHVAFHAKALK